MSISVFTVLIVGVVVVLVLNNQTISKMWTLRGNSSVAMYTNDTHTDSDSDTTVSFNDTL